MVQLYSLTSSQGVYTITQENHGDQANKYRKTKQKQKLTDIAIAIDAPSTKPSAHNFPQTHNSVPLRMTNDSLSHPITVHSPSST